MIRLRGIAVEVGVALLLHSTVCAAASRVLYAAPQSDCDGYPRLDIGMADGMCAGLVVGPTQGDTERRMALPRSLLQLDGDRWLVSDLGGWGTERGAIWLWQSESDEAPNLAPLLTGLNLPHALDIGPDGLVYVGEMGRIIRFDPAAKVPQQTIEVVVANLPDNRLHEHRHPLSSFVFAEDGALLVNVGAASDQCLDADGRPSGATCEEAESGEQTGSIRRYARLGPGAWSSEYTVHARGLRN